MADAIYNLILDDVNTLITPVTPAWGSATRKQIILQPRELETLPFRIIIPSFQAHVIREDSFEQGICLEYSVGIALIWAGNQTMETGLRSILNVIRDVRQALYKPLLPTASLIGQDPNGVWDVSMDLNPPFDVSALPLNVDKSLMSFRWKSNEKWSAP